MKTFVRTMMSVAIAGILLVSGFVMARPRQVKRVYVHVCDRYPAHIKVKDGSVTSLHPIAETLDVLDPEMRGNADINGETVWVFVDSWDSKDFEHVPWIAVTIWRKLHQPPIPAFNIDSACLYTERSRNTECWFDRSELGYRRMRDLAIEWERNHSWPAWEDIPADIKAVVNE